MSVRVILDNCRESCFPGQTIAGKIECNFDEETKLRALRIKFKGRAKTEWHRMESFGRRKRQTHRVRYYADEIYFNEEYNLVEGGEDFKLPAGQHTYPFSYILPAQLPSPFEGSHGNIRYYIKAAVDRPWKFDYEDKVSLNLVSPLDLNYLPEVREPVDRTVVKNKSSWWCTNSSGALMFTMSLPFTGFVPGQAMNIVCHVENMTNVNVENVKFKIYKMEEFKSRIPSKTEFEFGKFLEFTEGGIGAHGEKSWTASVKIPMGHFPNLNPCSIINIIYSLEVEVILPWPRKNLNTKPVHFSIGSIPLMEINTNVPVGPATSLLPAAGASYMPSSGDIKYPPPEGYKESNPSAPSEAPYLQASAPAGFSGASDPPGAAFGLPSYEDSKKSKDKKAE